MDRRLEAPVKLQAADERRRWVAGQSARDRAEALCSFACDARRGQQRQESTRENIPLLATYKHVPGVSSKRRNRQSRCNLCRRSYLNSTSTIPLLPPTCIQPTRTQYRTRGHLVVISRVRKLVHMGLLSGVCVGSAVPAAAAS